MNSRFDWWCKTAAAQVRYGPDWEAVYNELYAHLQTLSASYFHEHKAGEIMAYISSDIEAVRMVFAVTVMMGMDSLAIGISTLVKMITQIDPVLTVMAFLPMVLMRIARTR